MFCLMPVLSVARSVEAWHAFPRPIGFFVCPPFKICCIFIFTFIFTSGVNAVSSDSVSTGGPVFI